MNIKPIFALLLAAFVLPAPAADAGMFDDQMKALEATIAEADAKAEKTCAEPVAQSPYTHKNT